MHFGSSSHLAEVCDGDGVGISLSTQSVKTGSYVLVTKFLKAFKYKEQMNSAYS